MQALESRHLTAIFVIPIRGAVPALKAGRFRSRIGNARYISPITDHWDSGQALPRGEAVAWLDLAVLE
jgi:hypothetical protein